MDQGINKCVLVTGASGGIGKAVATRLSREGFSVAVHYAGNSESAEEVVAGIVKDGRRANAVQADITNPYDIERLFNKTLEVFGRIDAVVHTAGIMLLNPIKEGDLESFDKVITTNLRGTFIIFSHAAQHVAKGGRIVAFSSSVIAKSFPTYGAYIASKAGVEGLVHVLANELRGRNITVNAIAPGPVATRLFLEGKTADEVSEFKKLTPLERLGQPEDIANAVSFLVGPDGEWINGQVIRVNGGFA